MKMFVGKDTVPMLELGVWDKDSGKDEFMGRYVVFSLVLLVDVFLFSG